MDRLEYEKPISLSALHGSLPRPKIIFPEGDDLLTPPTVVGSFPTLPPPWQDDPPTFGGTLPPEQMAAGPAPLTDQRPMRALSGMTTMSFTAASDGSLFAEVDGEELAVPPHISAGLVGLLIEAYGYHAAKRVNDLGAAFGLWPSAQEGEAVPATVPTERVVPEVQDEGGSEVGSPASESQIAALLSAMFGETPSTGSDVPEVSSGSEGDSTPIAYTRPDSTHGDVGAAPSAFRALLGDRTKPAHAGESRGEIVGGPDRFVQGLPTGEHATDGGEPERGKGKRRGRPKKSGKASTTSRSPDSSE